MKSALILICIVFSSVVASPYSGKRIKESKGALLASKCTSGPEASAPIPVNLIVPKCQAPPCKLQKGQSYGVEIDFDVPRDTQKLTVVVIGVIGGLEIPWAGVGSNGCDSIIVGPKCPMKEGDYWTYGVEIAVEQIYPTTPLIIKWLMKDDTGSAIWCFHLPAEIIP